LADILQIESLSKSYANGLEALNMVNYGVHYNTPAEIYWGSDVARKAA